MQFRVQGRKIQCIRSQYDPSVQRCRQKLVVSFPSYETEPPPEALEALEADEQAQLSEWLAEREEAKRRTRAGVDIHLGAKRVAELAELVTAVSTADKDDPMAKHQAELKKSAAAIWEGIKSLESALKKAGFARPRRKYRRKQ